MATLRSRHALLDGALDDCSLVTWGSDDRVEWRMAAADGSFALVGRGLPARTQFRALLHRGPLRLHVGDLAGFEADLAAATGLADRLTGPEVALAGGGRRGAARAGRSGGACSG